MIFRKKESEGIAWWIISLDFRNGGGSEEFVETSKENVVKKIKDLMNTRENMLDDDDRREVTDYITVAKVKVVEVKYPAIKEVIELS